MTLMMMMMVVVVVVLKNMVGRHFEGRNCGPN
jgi:hypothetical protein